MSRPIQHAGAPFAAMHEKLVGLELDCSPLRDESLTPDLRLRALEVWSWRVKTEFRSAQTLTRFLSETLAAGDPMEVWAGAAEAVEDELRHTALCAAVVEGLGGTPELPDPPEELPSPEFQALPAAGRALATAVGMLGVSETLSVALIEDLHARCRHPVISRVLGATLENEGEHRDYGWAYVRASLRRFDEDGFELARLVARRALMDHEAMIAQVLDPLPTEERRLSHHLEPELADLGLFSEIREALVLEHAIATRVRPRLLELRLG